MDLEAIQEVKYHVQWRHEFAIVSAENHSIATATVLLNNGRMLITNVWTDPQHRKKGLATKVMQAVISYHGLSDLWLHATPYTDQPLHWEKLVAWYQTFGFELVNEIGTMKRSGRLT